MYDAAQSVQAILSLVPIGVTLWVGLLALMFLTFGVNPWKALDEIELAEAVLFGSWAWSSAWLVGELLPNFA